MSSTLASCAVCGSKEIREAARLQHYPAYIVPLPEDLAKGVRCGDLPLMNCITCNHLQQATPDTELQRAIYNTYYSYYTVDRAEALLSHYRVPFHNFFAEVAGNLGVVRPSLLEVGCSSGANIGFFRQFCGRYVGVDASNKVEQAQIEHPDCEFVRGYFPEARPAGRFNLLVSQFNLEHIVDLAAFLTGAWEMASDHATLVVQVPDIGEFVRRNQPNFLAHEHLQYFRQDQLAHVLQRCGWRPRFWAPQGASLICAAVRVQPAHPALPSPNTAEIDGIVRRLATAPEVRQDSVVMYGVGPQLFWLAQKIAPQTIKYVVDDNASYRGLHVPHLALPVMTLTPEMLSEVPYVVLSLNSIYHEKIIAKIRGMGRRVTVLACLESGWQEFSVN